MLCLETPRLFLRDYTPADLEAYFQLKADPEAMYYLPGARLFTREAAAAGLQRVLEDQAGSQRRCFFFHMELKPSREPVGSIGYTLLDSVPQGWLADAGYFSFPKLWGKGYTTEARGRSCPLPLYRERYTGCLQAVLPKTPDRKGFCKSAALHRRRAGQPSAGTAESASPGCSTAF